MRHAASRTDRSTATSLQRPHASTPAAPIAGAATLALRRNSCSGRSAAVSVAVRAGGSERASVAVRAFDKCPGISSSRCLVKLATARFVTVVVSSAAALRDVAGGRDFFREPPTELQHNGGHIGACADIEPLPHIPRTPQEKLTMSAQGARRGRR